MTYREGAEKYYDLFGEKQDAAFYIDLARKHGGKALELGVGTARLAVQLARAGIETWGIDNSSYMLRAAEKRCAKEPADVRSRVRLKLADVRNFDLDERFGLVYFPSFSFDHLVAKNDQVSTLRCVLRHLASEGVFAFDLAHTPRTEASSGWFVERKPLSEQRAVVRLGFHKTNPEKRLTSIDLWYELYESGRMLERYHERGEVYIHTPNEIKQLLEENGLEVAERYAGHDGQPFTDSSKMMVIVACPHMKSRQAAE